MKIPPTTQHVKCPDEMRSALLNLVGVALVMIRDGSGKRDVCYHLADLTHNIPKLIDQYDSAGIEFFWKHQVPAFHRCFSEIAPGDEVPLAPLLILALKNCYQVYQQTMSGDLEN